MVISPTGGVFSYLPHHLDLASEDSVGHSILFFNKTYKFKNESFISLIILDYSILGSFGVVRRSSTPCACSLAVRIPTLSSRRVRRSHNLQDFSRCTEAAPPPAAEHDSSRELNLKFLYFR